MSSKKRMIPANLPILKGEGRIWKRMRFTERWKAVG